VTLAAGGGLVPIVVAMLRNYWGYTAPFDSGLVASLLVGLAAALLGLDKAFGFSSAWARYALTATTIRKALVEFHLDWATLSANRCPTNSTEQTIALIQRGKDLISTVEGLVLQETRDWVTEFQSNMSQLEKDVKAQLDALSAKVEKARQERETAEKPGALELTVPDADKADQFQIQVTLEPSGGPAIKETVSHTKIWVRTTVPVGHCRIIVTAAVGGKPVSNQALADIKPGEVTKITVALQL